MFTKTTPKTDSQLSNENIADLVINDAINEIMQLTGMTSKATLDLFVAQVNQQTKNIAKVKFNAYQQSKLEQTEYTFISSLFN
jgi:hypothetical protein